MLKLKKKLAVIRNKKLVSKYPFILPFNVWTGDLPVDYNYENTWLDNMPDGWRNKLAIPLCKDIDRIVRRDSHFKEGSTLFHFEDVKEKWGMLTIYFSPSAEMDDNIYQDLNNLFDYYEELSSHVCIACGKEAKYITPGWITFYCERCARKWYKHSNKSSRSWKKAKDKFRIKRVEEKDEVI